MVTTRVRAQQSAPQTAGPVERPTPAPPRLRLSAVGGYLRDVAEASVGGAVQVDAHRHHGSPVLDDTRIPVSYVLQELAAGKSWAEITAEYPDVTEERIRAALCFAAAVLWRSQAEDVD